MIEFEGTSIPKPSGEADVAELHALSKACSLRDVRFINTRSKSMSVETPETSFGRHHLKVRAQLDGTSLMVSVRFMFQLSKDKTSFDDKNMIWECSLQLMLIYEVSSGTYQSSSAIGAFAFVNAVQSAWPYLRQALHETAFKHGIAGIVLPTRYLAGQSFTVSEANELSAEAPRRSVASGGRKKR